MIIESLNTSVHRANNEVVRSDVSHSPRRLLALSRKIVARQNTVFAHAMRYGAEQVPFNTHYVGWARAIKSRLAEFQGKGP